MARRNLIMLPSRDQLVKMFAWHPAVQSLNLHGAYFLVRSGIVICTLKKNSPYLFHVQSIVRVRHFLQLTNHYVWVRVAKIPIGAGTRPVSSGDGRIFSPRGERGGALKWSGAGTGVVFNPRGPVGARNKKN